MGAEVLYRRLLSVVDDYGRFHAAAVTLLGACWPTCPDRVTEPQVSEWLQECTVGERPLVQLYEVAGARYLQIQQFGQKVRSKSKFPEPNPLEVIHIGVCEHSVDRLLADCPQLVDNLRQNASTSRRRIRISESQELPEKATPEESSQNDDDRTNPKTWATPKDKLAALILDSTREHADRKLLEEIEAQLELRGASMREYLDDVGPRLGRLKDSPRAGFFLAHARGFGGWAQQPIAPTEIKGACCKWGRGTDGAICGKCELGKDLTRAEQSLARERESIKNAVA